MSIQKFPLAAVQKIRQYIHSVLVPPESERQPPSVKTFEEVAELPEPESLDALGDLFKFGGAAEVQSVSHQDMKAWFVSAINPADALLKLPGLSLKPNVRLVSYLYREEQNNHKGIIWAVQEEFSTTDRLESALQLARDADRPPKPEGALDHVMEAITGDRSHSSFMIASILRREFLEFGAAGKYRRWTHHRLVDAVPAQMSFQWRVQTPPQELVPRVRLLADGRAAVEFFTCRVAPPIAIFRHVDQYVEGHYVANSLDQAIAVAQSRSAAT